MKDITWHHGQLTREMRYSIMKQTGVTLWLTGMSASGKSTIATELEYRLVVNYGKASYRLDGDNVRHGLNKNLGFSPADRAENIRRIGEVALLMADAGLITIASAISPYKVDRNAVRAQHEANSIPFIEVYVDAPLAVVEERDPKGLYAKARQGLIPEFTGISAPYEAPEKPELHLRTDELSVEKCIETILSYLKEKSLLLALD